MRKDHSILIVTPDDELSGGMRPALERAGIGKVSFESGALFSMNGHANEVIGKHDVVIFDADPYDGPQIEALSGVLAQSRKNAIFFALTDSNVTVMQARKLREIGVEEVLPASIGSDEITRVVEDVLRRRDAARESAAGGAKSEGLVIPVVQARGGAGATTVAVNLACALVGKSSMFRKSAKKKVALLDFDLQYGNANVFLDLEDNGGLMDLMGSHVVPDASYLKGILQHHSTGVDLMTAPRGIAPLTALTPEMVASVLDELRREYDAVIVDMPRAMVDWIEPVLSRASTLVLVTDTAVPSIRHARRLMDFLKEDRLGLDVAIAVNREAKPLVKSQHHREAEKVLERKLNHWLPDAPKLCRQAADLGRPVVELKPGSDFAKAIGKLATEISASATADKHATA